LDYMFKLTSDGAIFKFSFAKWGSAMGASSLLR
jgi:hypothetical protein